VNADQEPARPGRPDPPPDGDNTVAGLDPSYLEEELRDALATAPGIHEQGISVEIGDRQVRLAGSVATPDQRNAIGRLARELVPNLEVVNAVQIVSMAPPNDVEEL
jgi:osmotically-inducible protein OsmY